MLCLANSRLADCCVQSLVEIRDLLTVKYCREEEMPD
jgi:hypothetical protein